MYANYSQINTATATSNTVTEPFQIEDDSRGLHIHVSAKQEYYQRSAISDGEPIEIRLDKDNMSLTDAEMKELVLSYDTQGLPYHAQPLLGESKILLWLEPSDDIETGEYKISVTATGLDELGRKTTATESCTIEIGCLALWQRYAIILSGIALILLAGWMYFNSKVLPKKILYDPDSFAFTVNGGSVTGSPGFKYIGGGKKKGTLSITMPMVYDNPLLSSEGITLSLRAVSPRWEKSKNRKAGVTDVQLSGFSVGDVSIGSLDLYVDRNSCKPAPVDGAPGDPIATDLLCHCNCQISGNADGTRFHLDITLIFK